MHIRTELLSLVTYIHMHFGPLFKVIRQQLFSPVLSPHSHDPWGHLHTSQGQPGLVQVVAILKEHVHIPV